jgi:DNA recombination protein RmuC
MADSQVMLYILVALTGLSLLACVALLLRKPKMEMPPELSARMTLLEQSVVRVVEGQGRLEGGSQSVERRLQAFTEETAAAFASSRQALDEQLGRTVEESRSGRVELQAAFQKFEERLDGRISALDQKLGNRFSEFQETIAQGLAASRTAVNEQLNNALEESRSSRAELKEAFGQFETKVEQRLTSLDGSMTARFEALQGALSARLQESAQALLTHLGQANTEAAAGRAEAARTLTAFREELAGVLRTLAEETAKSREAAVENATTFEARMQERFDALSAMARQTLESLKADVVEQLKTMSSAMKDQLEGNGTQIRNQFSTLQESVSQKLLAVSTANQQSSDLMRATLNERLAAIQEDNGKKLEEMRRTVDEKLHATLEQRLGDSFKLVSERLEQVHAGLGEMKILAGSVGDLKKVMTNVRTRGTWGEVQLGSIIEGLFTADQFQRNLKTGAGNSNEMVEFAVRIPAPADEAPVWLPIDSKYPVEHYQRLLAAHEDGDRLVIQAASSAFESSLKTEAKKISTKYIRPPLTTDFAIMFLPTEGLFAEAMRFPGLHEQLQTDLRVIIAGPTTLSALLNSVRLGFRTLAIERRSSEVWKVLGTAKAEFKKFGDIVDATKRSIDQAANKFDELGRRTRAIERNLSDVHELPSATSPTVPALELSEQSSGEGSETVSA